MQPGRKGRGPIGTRRVNPAVNTVRVRCANLESGERMPDGGEGEWKYNISAAAEDVRISYHSETKKNVLLPSMRNDMRRWFSCLLCFIVLSAANAIQKDPPPKRSEKLKHWRHVKQFAEYDAQDKKTTTKTLEELAEPPRYLEGRSADTSKLCRSRDLQAVREEGRGETCGEVVNGVNGIRISIDAPLAGRTLVSGGETEVKISINVENGAYEDLELRVMAHSDISHLQLYRAPVLLNADLQHTYMNLTSDVKITLGPGIWTLTAEVFPHTVLHTSTVVSRNLRIIIEQFIFEQFDNQILGCLEHYRSLRGVLDLVMSQLDGAHLEEARSRLGDFLRTFVDDVVHVAQIERLQEVRRTIDNELSQISASTLASHSIFCLTVSQESNNVRLTMEQGCPGLHELNQDTRGGFAEFTWMRTLECLFAFVNRFPDNYEAKAWLSRVLSVVGEESRKKGEGNSDRGRGMSGNVPSIPRWNSKTSISALQDAEDDSKGPSVYLSIIAMASHDGSAWCQVPRDHCLDRLRAFLVTTIHHLVSNGLGKSSEIILVEYNPAHSREDCWPHCPEKYLKISDAVQYLVHAHQAAGGPTIRVLTVREEQHKTIYNPHALPFLDLHAKNIGARRAKGQFILFTNPDNVWAEGLGPLIGRKHLRHDVFYVTHRGSLVEHVPVMPRTSACQMNDFIAEYGRPVVTVPPGSVAPKWNTSACAAGEVDDSPMTHSRSVFGSYMTQAPGDFFLVSRSALTKIRGYPEIPHMKHVDSLMVYAAAAHGLRQLVIPPGCSIYHQEHARSATSIADTLDLFTLSSEMLIAGSRANHRSNITAAVDYESLEWHQWNDGNWGWALENITETTLTATSTSIPSVQHPTNLHINRDMIAINFADQSRLYQHDPVFLHMPLTPLRVDPRFVTEHTGLKVPAEYDCANAFKSDSIWMEPEMIRILGYDYSQTDSLLYDHYNSVPSYWHACNNLQSMIRSGQKWFIPAYPVVDEEYIELVAVYQMAMKAKGTFSLVEIGARWGPWGFRSAAAIKVYNAGVHTVNLLFVEPELRSCAAIRKVAEVNDFRPPKFNVSIACEHASAEVFREWAVNLEVIDVFHMDCQGCEYELIPQVVDILNSKVRRVIVGYHDKHTEWIDNPLFVSLQGWVSVHLSDFEGGISCQFGKGECPGGECQKMLRGPRKWLAQSHIQQSCNLSKFHQGLAPGPTLKWDGDLMLDNPRFVKGLSKF